MIFQFTRTIRNTMKRTIILFALILLAGICHAQSSTQKWNDFYKRNEFYDSHGNLTGWAKYNDFYKRMEYFDKSGKLLKTESNNDFYHRKETKDRNGKIESISSYNDFYKREEVKDPSGKVIERLLQKVRGLQLYRQDDRLLQVQ